MAPLNEQERYYTSVLNKLTASEEWATSAATAHAYSLRAAMHLELKQYEQAKEDALAALAMGVTSTSSKTVQSKLYRCLADAEEGMGNIPAAIATYQEWHQKDPFMRTKIQKEIQRLLVATPVPAS